MLESNVDRYRLAFEVANAGMFIVAIDGTVEEANVRACEIFGLEAGALNGSHVNDLAIPDDFDLSPKAMERLLVGSSNRETFEKRYRHRSGRVIHGLVSVAVARDELGEPLYFVSQLQDITEKKHEASLLEQQSQQLQAMVEERTSALLRAKEEAESANRAKTLFLGNMSHEMRTPLHQISGIASLFRRDALSEKQQSRLQLMELAIKRMDNVIGGILSLVDLESKVTKLQSEPIDLGNLVANSIGVLKESAERKGLQLTLDIQSIPHHLFGDEQHLKTILMCFVNNAITYTETGHVHVRVSCDSEETESAMLRIQVEDEGIGIAPENLPRLFDIFEQVDNSSTRRFGGTGVGLAIVKKLAKLMGGDAGCHSELGKGSTFWATIRLTKGH